jgi:hypothetical protein
MNREGWKEHQREIKRMRKREIEIKRRWKRDKGGRHRK